MTARDLVEILDEIPGIGRQVAEVIIAEVGLDMTKWPTAGHMVSWAKLSPKTIQSGNKNTSGKTGKGNRYLKAVLGDAAAGAGKTKTFLGERHRRILRRRGKLKAVVATDQLATTCIPMRVRSWCATSAHAAVGAERPTMPLGVRSEKHAHCRGERSARGHCDDVPADCTRLQREDHRPVQVHHDGTWAGSVRYTTAPAEQRISWFSENQLRRVE